MNMSMFNTIISEEELAMLLAIIKGDEENDCEISKSNGKRESNRAQRRRDSYLAKRRKMARLFTDESDERKLREIGKEVHEYHMGWWTWEEAENNRKALRGAFAKCELNLPEPDISRVKVRVLA